MVEELLRLSKLMSLRGLCSRREADALIAQGLVFVDGVKVDQLGTKVTANQTVTLAPEAVRLQASSVTILLNKPVGYVSGQPEKGYQPAVVLLNSETQFRQPADPTFDHRHLVGLAPAGRLDIDSRGLLVFTQDGRIAKLLTAEDSHIEKEYLIRIAGDVTLPKLALLRHGLMLDGDALKPAQVERVGPDRLRFVLREGKHRQIRRMCAAVELEVFSLMRVRVGRIRIDNLPEGQWRFLRSNEAF